MGGTYFNVKGSSLLDKIFYSLKPEKNFDFQINKICNKVKYTIKISNKKFLNLSFRDIFSFDISTKYKIILVIIKIYYRKYLKIKVKMMK